jgi:hypothetical protein
VSLYAHRGEHPAEDDASVDGGAAFVLLRGGSSVGSAYGEIEVVASQGGRPGGSRFTIGAPAVQPFVDLYWAATSAPRRTVVLGPNRLTSHVAMAFHPRSD